MRVKSHELINAVGPSYFMITASFCLEMWTFPKYRDKVSLQFIRLKKVGALIAPHVKARI